QVDDLVAVGGEDGDGGRLGAEPADDDALALGVDVHRVDGAALLAPDGPAPLLEGRLVELLLGVGPDGHHLVVADGQEAVAGGGELEGVAGGDPAVDVEDQFGVLPVTAVVLRSY